MLRQEEWLHLAQRLAVGQRQRYPHSGDRTLRANLSVFNEPDRWGAYCQSCKEGGVIYKTHVKLTDTAPKESTLLTLPHDMKPVLQLDEFRKTQIAKFLARKNMDYLYLPRDIQYSESRMRLIVPTERGYSGRDLTERSNQKWLVYTDEKYVGEVHSGTTVVVEDLFSMYKVQWAMSGASNLSVVCSLGTAVRPALFLELIQKSKQVIFFYDGDNAGWQGATHSAHRVRTANVPAMAHCAPDKHDPKDMTIADIQTHLGAYH